MIGENERKSFLIEVGESPTNPASFAVSSKHIFVWSSLDRELLIWNILKQELVLKRMLKPPLHEHFTVTSLTVHPSSPCLLISGSSSVDGLPVAFCVFLNSVNPSDPMLKCQEVPNPPGHGQHVKKSMWLHPSRRSLALILLYSNSTLGVFNNNHEPCHLIRFFDADGPPTAHLSTRRIALDTIKDIDVGLSFVSICSDKLYTPVYALESSGRVHCVLIDAKAKRPFLQIKCRYWKEKSTFEFPSMIRAINSAPSILAIMSPSDDRHSLIEHYAVVVKSDEKTTITLALIDSIKFCSVISNICKASKVHRRSNHGNRYHVCDSRGRVYSIQNPWVQQQQQQHSLGSREPANKHNKSMVDSVIIRLVERSDSRNPEAIEFRQDRKNDVMIICSVISELNKLKISTVVALRPNGVARLKRGRAFSKRPQEQSQRLAESFDQMIDRFAIELELMTTTTQKSIGPNRPTEDLVGAMCKIAKQNVDELAKLFSFDSGDPAAAVEHELELKHTLEHRLKETNDLREKARQLYAMVALNARPLPGSELHRAMHMSAIEKMRTEIEQILNKTRRFALKPPIVSPTATTNKRNNRNRPKLTSRFESELAGLMRQIADLKIRAENPGGSSSNESKTPEVSSSR